MPNYQHKFRLHQPTIYLSAISLSLILGIAHGLADAAAGFVLGSLPRTMSLEQASWLIILYNILGFGYQPLAGMLTDKFQRPRLAVLGGLFSLLLALAIAQWHSQLAVILAGIGSAAFHVGGGALALTATPNRTTGPGIFAAPGVIGLTLGGAWGWTGYKVSLPIVILLGLMMAIVALIDLSKYDVFSHDQALSGKETIEYIQLDDWVLLVLLSAIALTSTVWTSFQFLLTNASQSAPCDRLCRRYCQSLWRYSRTALGLEALHNCFPHNCRSFIIILSTKLPHFNSWFSTTPVEYSCHPRRHSQNYATTASHSHRFCTRTRDYCGRYSSDGWFERDRWHTGCFRFDCYGICSVAVVGVEIENYAKSMKSRRYQSPPVECREPQYL